MNEVDETEWQEMLRDLRDDQVNDNTTIDDDGIKHVDITVKMVNDDRSSFGVEARPGVRFYPLPEWVYIDFDLMVGYPYLWALVPGIGVQILEDKLDRFPFEPRGVVGVQTHADGSVAW